MTFSEIRKMCEEIEYYAGHKLQAADDDEFKRLYRRVKDDEDLDAEAVRKLRDLFDRYCK